MISAPHVLGASLSQNLARPLLPRPQFFIRNATIAQRLFQPNRQLSTLPLTTTRSAAALRSPCPSSLLTRKTPPPTTPALTLHRPLFTFKVTTLLFARERADLLRAIDAKIAAERTLRQQAAAAKNKSDHKEALYVFLVIGVCYVSLVAYMDGAPRAVWEWFSTKRSPVSEMPSACCLKQQQRPAAKTGADETGMFKVVAGEDLAEEEEDEEPFVEKVGERIAAREWECLSEREKERHGDELMERMDKEARERWLETTRVQFIKDRKEACCSACRK